MNNRLRMKVEAFVQAEIIQFHQSRLQGLESLKLVKLLSSKNPYLFRAKNLDTASDLLNAVLGAWLSSSEEGMFGQFLEHLAIFVAMETCKGQKSSTTGIDLGNFCVGLCFDWSAIAV